MKKRQPFPTSIQNIALDLVFEVMGEDRIDNKDYMAVAAKLPPLKQLIHLVNKRLEHIRENEPARLYEICRFKAGDERHTYESFPTKISLETLRAALTISGMRLPKHAWRRKPLPKERPTPKRRRGVKPRRT